MFIRWIFLSLLFFFHLYSNTGSFIKNPSQIDPSYTAQVYRSVNSCYIGQTNQIVFTWSDKSLQNPYYAIYDVKSNSLTTNPTPINGGGYNKGTYQDIFCCYNSSSNQVVFSWASAETIFNPYYAIYDVAKSSFTTNPTLINEGLYSLGAFDVFCCYNSVSNQIVFSWADSHQIHPYYAIYDVKNGNFTTNPTPINVAVESFNVFCCYSSLFNQVVFSFGGYDKNNNGIP